MIVMDTKEFQQQIQGLWATRPYRPDDRTIAGVCTGIAARYRVDPTLVKVAFVVAAFFGGSGLILYLAAWVAFPGAGRARADALRVDSPRAGHTASHNSMHGLGNPQVILLVVLAIVIVTSFGPNRTWGSGGLVGAILMLGGWYLLYLRTPTPPAGTSIDTAAVTDIVVPPPAAGQFERWVPRAMSHPAPGAVTPTDGPQTPGVSMTKAPGPSAIGGNPATEHPATPVPEVELSKNEPLEASPPAWDPLGAARFAWDLPEPTRPAEPAVRRHRRSPLTLIVVGLATIVGAIGAGLHQMGVEWFTVPHILSLSLAVIGAGLLVAAVVKRRTGEHSTGLAPIAVSLGAAVIVTTVISGVNGLSGPLPPGGVGDREWKPLTENDIQAEYSLGIGEMALDLRAVELTADRTVRLESGVGKITVHVPETMNVRADCQTGVGDYNCPTGLDGGRDGTDGPVLQIEARTGLGEVEVLR
ncbi:PspC domain-containing protein [Gordonia hongkongensis]|uniref:PspC domain-containing protein n=1 Tax=Gordonia hongkongensis TaxID=1701090 RepID=A0AAX3TC28_9ACTN|nr:MULTISPECIES: PspC domain-containing protein [Gordonia]QIK48718.1 PspC domain-containing protein [Gordonia terrae]MBN0971388.1 PspC domain-containing protein [Gordonia sp. BP-119]MBN0982239.1 PspC domain-containing protein [Gordonia sp. BP-94]MDF6100113.1 PspC domain-containing protein [Gordonia hongkongensis]WFP26386.1 PspC domain-containing protein [Gordonia hongkongensis]